MRLVEKFNKSPTKVYYDLTKVKFKYRTKEDAILDLEGTFTFNEEELRAEIDLDPRYEVMYGLLCLYYDCMNMWDFKVTE